LVRYVLGESGYCVLEAHGDREALRFCEEHPGPIHLLITDVVMPEMGGRQLAEAVRALHPGIRVMFLSGYTDDAVVRHGVLREKVSFLQKPFAGSALTRKVREVLDETV
jgi:YesN/AraC family two-component response regulator